MNAVDKFLLKWGLILVGLFVGVGVLGYGCGRRVRGQLEERARTQRETVKALGRRADSIRTVYVHDTVTLVRYLTEWEQITDTLRVEGLPPQIRPLFVAADSVIRSCTATLSTCDQLQRIEHARADSALALSETYKRLAKGPLVSLYGEALHDLTGGTTLGAGVLLGRRLALTARGEADLSGGPVRAYLGVRFTF